MPRASRYLTFEGQYESSVLGTFRIIRGFADLQDLAAISVPYIMQDAGHGPEVDGQQRTLDTHHAERIKRYLESGEQRFLPEVILSVRTALTDELDQTQKPIGVRTTSDADGIVIGRTWKSQNIRVHRVQIDRKKLAEVLTKKLIRRVDGNHRLALAETLKADPSVMSSK
jgi:hypothetical protein